MHGFLILIQTKPQLFYNIMTTRVASFFYSSSETLAPAVFIMTKGGAESFTVLSDSMLQLLFVDPDNRRSMDSLRFIRHLFKLLL